MTRRTAFAPGLAALLLAASAAQAAVKPPSSPLQEKAFRHPDLERSSPHQPLSSLQPSMAAALGQELAALGVPADHGFYDVRAGRWGSLILSEPLIPGTGKGNALRWEDLGLGAQPDAKADRARRPGRRSRRSCSGRRGSFASTSRSSASRASACTTTARSSRCPYAAPWAACPCATAT